MNLGGLPRGDGIWTPGNLLDGRMEVKEWDWRQDGCERVLRPPRSLFSIQNSKWMLESGCRGGRQEQTRVKNRIYGKGEAKRFKISTHKTLEFKNQLRPVKVQHGEPLGQPAWADPTFDKLCD